MNQTFIHKTFFSLLLFAIILPMMVPQHAFAQNSRDDLLNATFDDLDALAENDSSNTSGGDGGSNFNINSALTNTLTNYLFSAGAQAETGIPVIDRLKDGVYILDACANSFIKDAIQDTAETGINAAVNGVVDFLSDTTVGEKIAQAAEFVENIPGVGGLVGGLVSGFLGGKKGPEEVIEPTIQREIEAQIKKEQCYDALAREAADRILASFSDETRKWVQFTGNLGNPRFVTNLGAQLRFKADEAFADFMNSSETFSSICGSYRDGITASLYNDYYSQNYRSSGYVGYQRPRSVYGSGQETCALEDVLGRGNTDVFLSEDFTRGGWNAWFILLEDTKSNPFSAYIEQSELLSQHINESREYELETLRYGNGFFPDYQCEDRSQPNADGRCDDGRRPTVATPGSIVERIIQKTLESDVDRAIYADEMSEIVSRFSDSLLGKVTKQGLRYADAGAPPPDSTQSLKIAQIRGSLLETLANLRDMYSIALFNQSKGTRTIPMTDTQFTIDDVENISARFGQRLTPLQPCSFDSSIDPTGENSEVCGSFTLNLSAFRGEEISATDLYEDLQQCGETPQSSIARNSFEQYRDSYNTRSLVPESGQTMYTYSILLRIIEAGIVDVGALLDELNDISSNPTAEVVENIDREHVNIINTLPHVGDLEDESVRMLELIQHMSHFRETVQGICSIIRPKIIISDIRKTDNGEEASPRFESYVDWTYEEINTNQCTASFTQNGIPTTFEGTGGDRYQIIQKASSASGHQNPVGLSLNEAVRGQSHGLILYHDNPYRLTITCQHPSGYGVGPLSNSRDFFTTTGSGGNPDKGSGSSSGGGGDGS